MKKWGIPCFFSVVVLCKLVSTDIHVSLLMLSAGYNLPNTRRTITLCTCDNLSQFDYLLRSIEGMFYNTFLGFSAENQDLEVLP